MVPWAQKTNNTSPFVSKAGSQLLIGSAQLDGFQSRPLLEAASISNISSSPKIDDVGSQKQYESQGSSPARVHWLDKLAEIKMANDLRKKEEAVQKELDRINLMRRSRHASPISSNGQSASKPASVRRSPKGIANYSQLIETDKSDQKESPQRRAKHSLQEFRQTIKKRVDHEVNSYPNDEVPFRRRQAKGSKALPEHQLLRERLHLQTKFKIQLQKKRKAVEKHLSFKKGGQDEGRALQVSMDLETRREGDELKLDQCNLIMQSPAIQHKLQKLKKLKERRQNEYAAKLIRDSEASTAREAHFRRQSGGFLAQHQTPEPAARAPQDPADYASRGKQKFFEKNYIDVNLRIQDQVGSDMYEKYSRLFEISKE